MTWTRRSRLGALASAAIVGGTVLLPTSGVRAATPFSFSTNAPDGRMAFASRPGPMTGPTQEIEAGDDFVLGGTSPTTITGATFTGLLPTNAPLGNISRVVVEMYRVFPKDSTNPPSGHVPTRVNSPSDVRFSARDLSAGDLSLSATLLNSTFTAANSVLNGINPIPNQTTGGEGPVTGEEVRFDVTFSPPIVLPPDHYFFVPQVLLSSGQFLWLSAPKPIVTPGTPFTPDLQAWMRNDSLAPDWLRVGTDIVGGSPAPTFNGAFSLNGVVGVPTTTSLSASPTNPTFGQSVTFTATVASAVPGNGTPTGSVDFFLDGSATPVATESLAAGHATFTTSGLGAGKHSMVARYDGDSTFAGSTSPPANVTVGTATTVTGSTPGGIIVPSGSTVLVRNADIGGGIIVQSGGSLDLESSTVAGSVTATTHPGAMRLCGNTIGGSVSVVGASGFVLVGDPGDDNCATNSIHGGLTLQNNTHGVEAIGNTVGGAVTASGNSGTGPFPEDSSPDVSGNHP